MAAEEVAVNKMLQEREALQNTSGARVDRLSRPSQHLLTITESVASDKKILTAHLTVSIDILNMSYFFIQLLFINLNLSHHMLLVLIIKSTFLLLVQWCLLLSTSFFVIDVAT